MLKQYLYISTAPDLTTTQVDAILDKSARKNARSGISGMLIYNGRNFLQLLEGQGSALDALMHTIAQDPRHSGITMLHSGVIDAPQCAGWAMKRVALASGMDGRRNQLQSEFPAGLDPDIHRIVRNFAMLN